MADLTALIKAIPDVQDGDVITATSHMSIKAALLAVAGALGGATGGQSKTVTLPPNLQPIAGAVPWNVKVGFAEDNGHASDGWIPINLPDGVVLTSLGVVVLKTNATPSGSVNLFAVPIDNSNTNLLASINLNTIALNNTLSLTQNVKVLSALTGLLTVQNAQFKYVVEANVNFSTAAASVTIFAIQVAYTTP